ncbi:MAG: hypothetical protein AB4352_27065 [Hormoscilla sp.]
MESFNIKVVETMEIPKDYEAEFLRYIAAKLDLQPSVANILTERLSEDKLEYQWDEIVESLQPHVTAEEARKNRWSREILPKLRKLGFTYEDNARRLWVQARQWLAQTQYGPWLWEMLADKSQRTQQMGFREVLPQPFANSARHSRPQPVVSPQPFANSAHSRPQPVVSPRAVADLGRHRRRLPYVEQVKVGSELILQMTLTEAANLTLLGRETDGTVVCFCPSGEYAPNNRLSAGMHELPQLQEREGTYQTFAATDVGKEQWLALLTSQTDIFEWLKPSPWEPLELQPSHLQEMLEYVTKHPQARLLSTELEIV